MPLVQYLKELYLLRMEDRLPSYIPSSILIQNYVYFRIALRRYAVWVAKPLLRWHKSCRPLNFNT